LGDNPKAGFEGIGVFTRAESELYDAVVKAVKPDKWKDPKFVDEFKKFAGILKGDDYNTKKKPNNWKNR